MNIARILYPVKALGPGNRIGIWVSGCPRRCLGCINPELWEQRSEYEITLSNLKELIGNVVDTHNVDGFTITGGEPMSQPQELAELITYLKTISRDIIIYSGYKYDELRLQNSCFIDEILGTAAVLVDGVYIEELNTNVALRGSENQNVIVLNNEYKAFYENYMKTADNKIQNFTTTDGIVSVGIHRREFKKNISNKIFHREV
ncbi:4Fe-4S single cluster domain-containing protein [Paenibacillus sp. FSL R10-2734]|uniref:4Fe-4S single cluster domain-containing protein n=1 Tax=Paenibacillus sp. FSL R10-2734 TaxID=2954691 RepID=UPI0030DC174C